MFQIYGYGYVKKPTKYLTRSTAWKALRGRFLPKENIYIDVLESPDSREKLKLILKDIANEGDTIVIMNRRALGETNEFRQWWYEITFTRKLNLLIVDDNAENGVDYYSTTNFSFVRYDESAIDERWEKLQTDKFERQTNKVGRRSLELTDKFIETYWAYQSFFVTVDDAVFYLGVSRQTFYNMCKKYEKTDQYKKELLQHEELLKYPRRGGIPQKIEHLFFIVEGGQINLQEACKIVGLKEILPEEYDRYLLAKIGGRKEQIQMEKKHHINDYLIKMEMNKTNWCFPK